MPKHLTRGANGVVLIDGVVPEPPKTKPKKNSPRYYSTRGGLRSKGRIGQRTDSPKLIEETAVEGEE